MQRASVGRATSRISSAKGKMGVCSADIPVFSLICIRELNPEMVGNHRARKAREGVGFGYVPGALELMPSTGMLWYVHQMDAQ